MSGLCTQNTQRSRRKRHRCVHTSERKKTYKMYTFSFNFQIEIEHNATNGSRMNATQKNKQQNNKHSNVHIRAVDLYLSTEWKLRVVVVAFLSSSVFVPAVVICFLCCAWARAHSHKPSERRVFVHFNFNWNGEKRIFCGLKCVYRLFLFFVIVAQRLQ